MPVDNSIPLLHQVKAALGNPADEQLGRLAGVSRRTVQRWWAAQGLAPAHDLLKFVPHVYPRNRDLAVRIAGLAGTTLEALGLEAPAPPAPPPVPRAPEPPPPLKALPEHADSVVYAAADALELAPKAVRPAVIAAFAQAKRLGLTVDALLPELARTAKPAAAAKK